MKGLIAIVLLGASSLVCHAQEPVHAAKHNPVASLVLGTARALKDNFYTDCRNHFYSHCLTLAARFGVALLDTKSSCDYTGSDVREVGPAHFFIGRYPSCHKFVILTLVAETIHTTSVDYLSHRFEDACKRDAANKNSRWYKVDAHTYSSKGCYAGVEATDLVVQAAVQIPIAVANFNINNEVAHTKY